MNYFQIAAFIFEVLFLSGIIVFLALISLKVVTLDDNRWLYSPKIHLRLIDILGRILLIILSCYLAYTSLLPRLLDVPSLIGGNYLYTEGTATIRHGESKDPYTYVTINQTETAFFMGMGIKDGEYKIGYLPHSHRAILIEKKDNLPKPKQRAIGFPWAAMAIIIYAIVVVGIFERFGHWVLAIATSIFYPAGLYHFIHYGLTMRIWFSFNNEGFTSIVLGLSLLIMLPACYFLEGFLYKRKVRRNRIFLEEEPERNLSKYISHIIAMVYWFYILNLFNVI